MIKLTAIDGGAVYYDPRTGLIVRKPPPRKYAKNPGAELVINGYACAVAETPDQVRALVEGG